MRLTKKQKDLIDRLSAMIRLYRLKWNNSPSSERRRIRIINANTHSYICVVDRYFTYYEKSKKFYDMVLHQDDMTTPKFFIRVHLGFIIDVPPKYSKKRISASEFLDALKHAYGNWDEDELLIKIDEVIINQV